jgi:hypothetical protein
MWVPDHQPFGWESEIGPSQGTWDSWSILVTLADTTDARTPVAIANWYARRESAVGTPLHWFLPRWQIVASEVARRHLDAETLRQWSALAIRHATPELKSLFSSVVPLAQPYSRTQSRPTVSAGPPGATSLTPHVQSSSPWSDDICGATRLPARRAIPVTW